MLSLHVYHKFIFIMMNTVDAADNKDDNAVVNNISRSDHIGENVVAIEQTVAHDQQPTTINASTDEHPITVDLTPFNNTSLFFNLTLRSLGVIFGDIGTSPLYVLSTVFNSPPMEADCIGIVSLIIWSLIVAVSIKYGIFVLMADNQGEGGTFALCGLLTSDRSFLHRRWKKTIIIVALLAGSFLLGDGALTPAVSVLSAVEGIAVEASSLTTWTVPITIVILIILFLVQRWGTSKIGATFGPIMCLWFACLFIIGIWRVTIRPSILKAFNPWEALHYLIVKKKQGFYQIGGVFLSVTGLEALYADLGHFGRWPIRCSWFFVVFPAVTLNYLGQGALLIADSSAISNPFYRAVPHWAHWPMVILATVATIIASQAIITGSFSLISQAVGMECSVPLKICHTSKTIAGQIYVPTINYILMILAIAIVAGFQKGSNITNAYGVTVCGVMVITTILYTLVIYYRWRKPWYFILPFSLFLIIDLYTFSSNLLKIPSGGWVAILIGSGSFILGFCWFFGQTQLRRFLKKHSQTTSLDMLPMRLGILAQHSRQNSVASFSDIPIFYNVSQTESDNISCSDSDSNLDFDVDNTETLPRVRSFVKLVPSVPMASSSATTFHAESSNTNIGTIISAVVTPGVACFLTMSKKHTPDLFENFVARMHAIPQVIIFLKIEHTKRAIIKNDQRLSVKTYGDNIYHITALYGYSEYQIKPYDILLLAHAHYNVPIPDTESQATVFVTNETIKVLTIGWRSWIRRWPLYVYSILKSLYPGAAVNIELNPENTISIGILAELG